MSQLCGWCVAIHYTQLQSRIATLFAEWCKAVALFTTECVAVLSQAINLSWNYNN